MSTSTSHLAAHLEGSLEQRAGELARRAKAAGAILARSPTAARDAAVNAMARGLADAEREILEANRADVEAGRRGGLTEALVDRLQLDAKRIAGMVGALREVHALADPVGQVAETWQRPNGMQVSRVRIPLGVILMIYEARPNATAEAAGLCVKSGNAAILRGGKEALGSNQVIARTLRQALRSSGLPEDSVQVVDTPDRALLDALLARGEEIDLCIPRGGPGLIEQVAARARMPVVRHAQGVCHVYVHATAGVDMATRIAVDSKASRPAVCNAAECLLIDRSAAPEALPAIGKALAAASVELRCCPTSLAILERAGVRAREAEPGDYGREFLDRIMAVRVVKDLDDALAHIARYGTGHTEAIVTNDYVAAKRFEREVVASAVMVNASTRLNDGGALGLGAEIGISTSRLHAYGPMGLRELTTLKFVVEGTGQLRS